MKKFLAVLFSFLCVCINKADVSFVSLLDSDYCEKFIIYTDQVLDGDVYEKCGNGYFVFVDYADCVLALNSHNVYGQTVIMKQGCELDTLLEMLGAKVVYEDYIGDIKTIYAYNSNLSDSVEIDGKRVNLQLATDGELTKVGYPLILDSF